MERKRGVGTQKGLGEQRKLSSVNFQRERQRSVTEGIFVKSALFQRACWGRQRLEWSVTEIILKNKIDIYSDYSNEYYLFIYLLEFH